MSDQPTVEVAQDNGHKNQWINWLGYKREGLKQVMVPSKAKWAALAFAIIPMVILLFKPTPPEKRQSSIENVQGVSHSVEIPEITAQARHEKELKSSKPHRYRGPQIILRPFNDNFPPGAMVKAVLVSGASHGPVRAELTEPLVVGGETIVESGSSLLGFGSSTEDRLYIEFTKLVSKDGAVRSIKAQACDWIDRIVGLKGSKIGKTALKVSGAVGLGFIGGLAEGLQQTSNQNGLEIREPSLRNAALNGTAKAALGQSQEMLNSLKNEKPIIEVQAGAEIHVLFVPAAKGDRDE